MTEFFAVIILNQDGTISVKHRRVNGLERAREFARHATEIDPRSDYENMQTVALVVKDDVFDYACKNAIVIPSYHEAYAAMIIGGKDKF